MPDDLYAGSTSDNGKEQSMNADKRLLTAFELAEALSVSVSTVRRLSRHGQIPTIRVRALVRYDLDDVLEALGNWRTVK